VHITIHARRIVMAAAAFLATLGIGVLVSPVASAATTATATSAATCSSTNNKLGGVKELSQSNTRPSGDTAEIELWYSATCRYAWAVEENGDGGDLLWVYNQDTGAETSTTFAYPNLRVVTAAIDDAGTTSHACMDNTGNFPMAKTCTGYF
jgi:hypothetical protein